MSNLTIILKPSVRALSQPLRMAVHTLDWGDLSNQCRRGGKQVTMVAMFVGGSCVDCSMELLYYSYRMKLVGWEFFVPHDPI